MNGSLVPGTRLGPYEILGLVGAGGMGRVYRARDTRPSLGREVAVKVLAEGLSRPEDIERFEREARVSASLNHPNIVTVHDVGVAAGMPYVVTELLDGRTLRRRLQESPVDPPEAVGLLRQLLDGLAAAHERGVVHRDLKPENLYLTRSGLVKIVDFGLARLSDPVDPEAATRRALTAAGAVFGTPAYMPPEQIQGQVVDQRSDLFAVGAIAYEMLAGRSAFPGATTFEVLSSILTRAPAPLPERVPDGLAAMVMRCLEKAPDQRWPSALELLRALHQEMLDPPTPRRGRRRVSRSAIRSVAVLPFVELGAGDSRNPHLAVGLADATITELATFDQIIVRPTSTSIRYAGQVADARGVGRDLGVDAVVQGSFQCAGSSLRATVQIVTTVDGATVWAAKIDASLDDLFQAEDEVAAGVARALRLGLTRSGRSSRRARAHRATPGAYDAYLQGRSRLLRETLGDYMAAIDWFERAKQLDPGFAPAIAGLADASARIAFGFQPDGNWFERAREYCDEALKLDAGLAEGLQARARLRWSPQGGWDHAGAIKDLAAAIRGRPSLDEAYCRLGCILYHVGLIDEAEVALARSVQIAPGNTLATYHIGFCRYHQLRFREALTISLEVARAAPANWILYQLAICQIRMEQFDAAEASVAAMLAQNPDEPMVHPILGLIAATRGNADEARRRVALTSANQGAFGHYHHARYEVACLFARLGDSSEAIHWLTESTRDGYPCLPFVERDPLLDSLRGDPRFAALLEELRVERRRYAELWRQVSGDLPAIPAWPVSARPRTPSRRSPTT